jgi:ketosteroid isomerase-like protein
VSRENVETVRRALDALNHGDVDRYLTCCTDNIELRPPISAIEGAYEGQAGVRRFSARKSMQTSTTMPKASRPSAPIG